MKQPPFNDFLGLVQSRRFIWTWGTLARGEQGTGGGHASARTELNLMVSAHMDDFKATGPQPYLNWLRDVLSNAFGGDVNMEQEDSFIHTGIKHTRIQEKDPASPTMSWIW